MIEKTTYICSECGKEYRTKEDALRCEEDDRKCCHEKHTIFDVGEIIYKNGIKVKVTLDFYNKNIHLSSYYNGHLERYVDFLDIKYCPFCGRKL